jgi:cardiolipin synthase
VHWTTLLALIDGVLALVTSGHAILNKRDPRSAVAWVGFAWLVPFLGPALYWLLGVNRIPRRAARFKRLRRLQAQPSPAATTSRALVAAGPDPHLASLAQAVDVLARSPLTVGNCVEFLEDGDAAYPQMLRAIAQAKRTVALESFIFDNDTAGGLFVTALGDAQGRGADVRVLVDAVGARYCWPTVLGPLRSRGLKVATFLPALLPTPFANLRNHRKLLVVDGTLAFTGGMNIRDGHVLGNQPRSPVRDLHFRLQGPVVTQLADCFAEDWAFTTGEVLGESWRPPSTPEGSTLARAISDGPDDDFEVLTHVILAALASAQRSIRLVTPYFVPNASLITGLNVAALRGVRVDILIPERGNIPLAQWASTAMLWQVLERGCRVHLSPAPFDHTKLLVIDEAWALFGSANWDARSLRLNFELNVEAYDVKLAAELADFVDRRIARARTVDLAWADSRPFLTRLRDSTAKLLAPYL